MDSLQVKAPLIWFLPLASYRRTAWSNMTFVDLTKAFDTVSREGLWKIMSKFGCPDRFVKIVRQMG